MKQKAKRYVELLITINVELYEDFTFFSAITGANFIKDFQPVSGIRLSVSKYSVY